MDWIVIVNNLLLPPFLFGLLLCIICLLLQTPKTDSKPSATLPPSKQLEQKFSSLACLLEDIPENYLQGQAYELAYPLMTPLACILEDIPEKYLRGQAYELAYPLMTSLACIVTKTWHQFYQENLAKVGINYWEWRDKPESRNVNIWLTQLLDLPQPKGFAKEILESLAISRYSCFHPTKGIFRDRDLNIQNKMRWSFEAWHNFALKKLGKNSLRNIYRVCYQTPWSTIEKILTPIAQQEFQPKVKTPQLWWQVLEVSANATPLEVELAYKKLIKMWHPDLNRDPQATEMTSRINVAYQEYKNIQQEINFQTDRLPSVFSELSLQMLRRLLKLIVGVIEHNKIQSY
jgi:hypothetical protein